MSLTIIYHTMFLTVLYLKYLFALKSCIYIYIKTKLLVYIHFFQIWNMWRLFIYFLVFFFAL
jgi:hypothetical protein